MNRWYSVSRHDGKYPLLLNVRPTCPHLLWPLSLYIDCIIRDTMKYWDFLFLRGVVGRWDSPGSGANPFLWQDYLRRQRILSQFAVKGNIIPVTILSISMLDVNVAIVQHNALCYRHENIALNATNSVSNYLQKYFDNLPRHLRLVVAVRFWLLWSMDLLFVAAFEVLGLLKIPLLSVFTVAFGLEVLFVVFCWRSLLSFCVSLAILIPWWRSSPKRYSDIGWSGLHNPWRSPERAGLIFSLHKSDKS